MVQHTIMEWLDDRTRDGAWTKTYETLGIKGQAAADIRLQYLRCQPKENWKAPHSKLLKSDRDNDCKEIYEIRFKANNVQQRPLGYFIEPNFFVVVLWATHKDKAWAPRNYCNISSGRKKAINNGCALIAEIEID